MQWMWLSKLHVCSSSNWGEIKRQIGTMMLLNLYKKVEMRQATVMLKTALGMPVFTHHHQAH